MDRVLETPAAFAGAQFPIGRDLGALSRKLLILDDVAKPQSEIAGTQVPLPQIVPYLINDVDELRQISRASNTLPCGAVEVKGAVLWTYVTHRILTPVATVRLFRVFDFHRATPTWRLARPKQRFAGSNIWHVRLPYARFLGESCDSARGAPTQGNQIIDPLQNRHGKPLWVHSDERGSRQLLCQLIRGRCAEPRSEVMGFIDDEPMRLTGRCSHLQNGGQKICNKRRRSEQPTATVLMTRLSLQFSALGLPHPPKPDSWRLRSEQRA